MKNPWLERVTRKIKKEEARKVLEKRCIRKVYNDEAVGFSQYDIVKGE